MAIIKTGAIVSDIRGKVGDVVFSRGQSGPTARSIGTWTQPDSAAQVTARNILHTLSRAWSSTLTNAQRQSWRSYANTNPRPNRWGQLSNNSGYLAFVRHNAHALRIQAIQDFPTPPAPSAIRFLAAPSAPPIHPPTVSVNPPPPGRAARRPEG